MKAGRELDEKVAREVMGWTKATLHDEVSGPEQYWCSGKVAHVLVESWTPSTFIHYAWQVVEKLRELRANEKPYNGIVIQTFPTQGWSVVAAGTIVYSDSLPEAICLAALKAVGVEVDSPK